MRSVTTVFLLYVCLSFVTANGNEMVMNLDSDSWEDTIKGNSDIFVVLYSTRCPECESIKPIYIELSKRVQEEGMDVKFAKIDVIANPKIGRQLDIKGIPTLLYFKSGTKFEYTGRRELEAMHAFIRNIYRESAESEYKSLIDARVHHIRDVLNESNLTIIGCFLKEHTKLIQRMDDAVKDILYLTRMTIDNRDVASQLGLSFPSIALYQSLSDYSIYEGDYSVSSIRQWVGVFRLPLIVPYNLPNSKLMFSRDHTVRVQVLLFADTVNDQLEKQLKLVAGKYRGRLFIVSIPLTNPRLLGFYGVDPNKTPAIRLVDNRGSPEKKYAFEGEISGSALIPFIESFFKDELKEFYRSEDVPDEMGGFVYTLVGSTFAKYAYNPNKDVVIKFYTSWDGDSKDFESIYENVAKKYIRDGTISFMEIEMTKNEIEGLRISVFPTIILYQAGGDGRRSVTYSGMLEEEPFTAFVESHRGHASADDREL